MTTTTRQANPRIHSCDKHYKYICTSNRNSAYIHMNYSSIFYAIVDIWLVVSNLAFLIPAIRASEYARRTRAALFYLIVIFSGTYHTCRSNGNLCIFTLQQHQLMDFFFAELTIPLTALYLIPFTTAYVWVERWAIIAFAILIFILQLYTEGNIMVQVVIVLISSAVVIGYWVSQRRLPVSYNWVYLQRGLVLTSLSVALFAIQGRYMQGYWAIHSDWHVLGALGQNYILQSRPPANPRLNLDTKIQVRAIIK